MNTRVSIACFAACFLGVMTFSADVSYTGGGVAGRLSDPANWGGMLPTSSDIAVVDVSKFASSGVASVTLLDDFSVKGLSFTGGNAGTSIYLGRVSGSEPRLTIGESGLTVDSCWQLVVQLDVTLVNEQTWSIGSGGLVFRTPASLSGTDTLTFSSFRDVSNEVPLNFGGTISYTTSDDSNHFVWNKAAGHWAQSVSFTGKYYPALSFPSGSSSVSEMFSDRKMTFSKGPALLDFGNYGHDGKFATFRIEDGDEVILNHDSALSGGNLEMSGGTLTLGTYFDVGVSDTFKNTAGVSHTNSVRFLVSGGAVSPAYLGVGRARSAYADGGSSKKIVQTDGAVGEASRSYALIVGGGASTTDGTYPEPLAEYRFEGGTLNFPNANNDYEHGLALSCNHDTSVGTIPGVFTQTGGVATVAEVQFGSRKNGWWGSPENAKPNDEGYGLFDLAGGVFNLGNNGFQLAPKWNPEGAQSNAVYKVRLRGGKLALSTTQTNALALDVTPGEDSTIDVASGKTFVQGAPLRGSGTLRKTGAGTLVVKDGTRFTGDLKVEEGRVVIEGKDQDVDGALVWTADRAVGDLEDGAEISTWADESNTYVAEANTVEKYTLKPMAKLNAFNGHAGVRFYYDSTTQNSASMMFPSDKNALFGLTNFTVVVVARSSKTEQTADVDVLDDGTWLWCDSILGNSFASNPNFFALQYTKDGACIGGREGSTGDKPRCAVLSDMRTDVTSVIVASRRGNAFEINVNGVVSNRVYAASEFDGNLGCWVDPVSLSLKQPLYIACNGNAASDYGHNRGFKGDIAEIRIYRDKVLSSEEKESLVMSLVEKYESSANRVAQLRYDRNLPAADIFAESAAPDAPDGATTWNAEALAALDSPGDKPKPEKIDNAINGKSVVRFDGTQALVIPVSASPISGTDAFSVAVVFRTIENGVDENTYAGGLGLVSSLHGDGDAADFVLSWRNEGCVGAGYGTTSENETIFSFKPCRLNDGEAHVAIFAVDPTLNAMRLMTDGRLTEQSLSLNETEPRGNYPVCIGALTTNSGYFKGDIAEVVMYNRALSAAEMETLSESCAAKYRFGLLGKKAYASQDLTSRGLSARSISVASGASLVLPGGSSGLSFSSGGGVFSAGNVIGNISILDGAKLTVDWNNLPATLGNISASGEITIYIENAPKPMDRSGRLDLFKVEDADFVSEVMWKIDETQRGRFKNPVFDPETNIVYTKINAGLILTFR